MKNTYLIYKDPKAEKKELIVATPKKWDEIMKTNRGATLKIGKVLSCGCLYKQTRSDIVKYRKDLVAGTSISNIVVSKRLRSNNTSGHTGVWHDKKHDRWHAFINFQGKHYNLGTHPTFQSAVKARRAAEERLHDPAIIAHIETLTEERRKEFAMYLRNNGGTI